MRLFSDFVESNELIDPPLIGGWFTWLNNREVPSISRLDRFLFSPSWEEHFPRVTQVALPRPLSDHIPLLLDSEGMRMARGPFRFENMWLEEEGFVELVSISWGSYSFSGSSSYVFSKKLKALKDSLKIWNKDVFGNIKESKDRALEVIHSLNEKEGRLELSVEEKASRMDAKAEFARLARLEEISWHQKSRVLWLKEGDKNTKFFHRMANAHKKGNYIRKLIVNGALVKDENIFAREIVDYYENLFYEEEDWRPLTEDMAFKSLDLEEANGLERVFDELEVLEAINELNGDKAPGPDGFTIAFFQKCWRVIKDDLMKVFEEFFAREKIENSLNATFIALIPKKGEVVDV
ncbi:hypothetical protein L1049_014773 [Liquidambar formosana]|uniref:Reverse transcriptase n=1 Tax=Liquidambar formosana TaxID=63359 RepID=A0AAP0RXR9_LIQFO